MHCLVSSIVTPYLFVVRLVPLYGRGDRLRCLVSPIVTPYRFGVHPLPFCGTPRTFLWYTPYLRVVHPVPVWGTPRTFVSYTPYLFAVESQVAVFLVGPPADTLRLPLKLQRRGNKSRSSGSRLVTRKNNGKGRFDGARRGGGRRYVSGG